MINELKENKSFSESKRMQNHTSDLSIKLKA